MSLDIWGKVSTGGPEPVEIWSFNITHNLSQMWTWAGCYDALYESYDKRASEILPILKAALKKLKAHPEEAKRFSASNGWGTYEQAVPWLERVIATMTRHPDTIVGLSK